MDNLTQKELEEYWALAFQDEDAETCFAIDSHYTERFGMKAWMLFVDNRILKLKWDENT